MIDQLQFCIERISKIGVPTATLSRLAGISDSRLRSYLNRQTSAPAEEVRKIDATLRKLEDLVSASPLPLDLKKAEVLRQALEKIDSGDLTILSVERDAVADFPHIIRFADGRYFCGRNPESQVLFSPLILDALVMPHAVAKEIVTKLKSVGYTAKCTVCRYRVRAATAQAAWGLDLDNLPIEPAEPQGTVHQQ